MIKKKKKNQLTKWNLSFKGDAMSCMTINVNDNDVLVDKIAVL